MAGNAKKIIIIVGIVIAMIVLAVIAANVVPKIMDLVKGSEDEDLTPIIEEENLPPVALITANASRVEVGIAALFDGNRSYDPDPVNDTNNGISLFSWDFGDKSDPESDVNGTAVHTYEKPGKYNVTLTVLDQKDKSDTDTFLITVVEKELTFSSGTQVMIGEPILIGVIGNSTEERWNISKDAVVMEIEISVTGVDVMGTTQAVIDCVLFDPYEDVMKNETVEIIGSNTLQWIFGPEDISITGEYYVFAQCHQGVSAVTISGRVSYL